MNVNKEIFDLYIESSVIDKPLVEIVTCYNNLSDGYRYVLENKIINVIDTSMVFSPSDIKDINSFIQSITAMNDFIEIVISMECACISEMNCTQYSVMKKSDKDMLLQIIKNCRIIVDSLIDQISKFYNIYSKYSDEVMNNK